ncbi:MULTISPECIES: biliverdin-producing heme oxygenase [Bradyrhizobium]|uniref:biliverdin-producing heme oxygenase n=1 Tax=Bradyrhizobium TaxID=374 RepID=UPI0021A9F9A1|nr:MULTISPECIES: biliverdin-producing heme oxygenase [Bradyrhizobium]MDF0492997.1 biliverdin-producing heme oxygenase [Bradyrhizobium yuanmingense]UWU67715.1 biliverdin-producing heme oxygenase [Bradyrhizobium sp. NC92]
MSTIDVEKPLDASRARRLKAATSSQHDSIDKQITAQNPFANRERYGRFVTVQREFHRAIDGLYVSHELGRWLPGLSSRRRLGLIEQDLCDLGIAAASPRDTFELGCESAEIDLPTAIGWLYVAEGSNLGAASLLKAAGSLGLSESFGARHLAAAPEGRAAHWRAFTRALDAVDLSVSEDERAVAGARAAFSHVQELVSDLHRPAAEI